MNEIAPTEAFSLVQILERGDLQEKLALIDGIEAEHSAAPGVLLRLVLDDAVEIRRAAMGRLEALGVRPEDTVLDGLATDADPVCRDGAERLRALPDPVNMVAALAPVFASITGALGEFPFARQMDALVDTLQSMQTGDESTQCAVIAGLTPDNPATALAIYGALASKFTAVRIGAIEKALELPAFSLPSPLVASLSADSDPEVRRIAREFKAQGRVEPSGDLIGALTKSIVEPMFEIEEATALNFLAQQRARNPVVHQVTGRLFLVADARGCERAIEVIKGSLPEPTTESISLCQIRHPDAPGRWSIGFTVTGEEVLPQWARRLRASGLPITEVGLRLAERARLLSETFWGAAFADYSCDPRLTLVFHDGALTRAEWLGEQGRGGWCSKDGLLDHSRDGPFPLLCGFLDDPTDTTLKALPVPTEPLIEG